MPDNGRHQRDSLAHVRPAVDTGRTALYVTTGNKYWAPLGVVDCINAGGPAASCMSADNHFDSVLVLDATTCAIRWAGRGLPDDGWNVACGLSVAGVFSRPRGDTCPALSTPDPDWDFAQGPVLFGDDKEGGRDVGAGQKSGMYWAFEAKSGALVWATQVAPDGVTGGLRWGSATDGRRLYVAISNRGPPMNGGGGGAVDWTLKDGTGPGPAAGQRWTARPARCCGRPRTLMAAAPRGR